MSYYIYFFSLFLLFYTKRLAPPISCNPPVALDQEWGNSLAGGATMGSKIDRVTHNASEEP